MGNKEMHTEYIGKSEGRWPFFRTVHGLTDDIKTDLIEAVLKGMS
jgi:hypothetical protein